MFKHLFRNPIPGRKKPFGHFSTLIDLMIGWITYLLLEAFLKVMNDLVTFHGEDNVLLRIFHPLHSFFSYSHSPHSHALQELKDDLIDDTAWPVVMQWFNEDHEIDR